ncbi:hypothetical protein FYZ48_26065 [Gimesia chilikensis]|uniref:hypothetical protein n=1 Tax=Gimesia chilikensis TaxID=2605989 RepID=UPI0011EC0E75|nr:hypothetical protein [Gimesia chilikensis]KAA0131605.1 hypothetical protein FYZ48_26065 [Gimesia chilikensis]
METEAPTRMDKIRALLNDCDADYAAEILLALAADYANHHFRKDVLASVGKEMTAASLCWKMMEEVFASNCA